MLSATQFLLAETNTDNYQWGLCYSDEDVNVYQQIGGVQILSAENTIDGNTYLISSESMGGADYSVYVVVGVGVERYYTKINVIAAKYPSSISLNYNRVGSIEPRYVLNNIILW
jgi:hypothetical protein